MKQLLRLRLSIMQVGWRYRFAYWLRVLFAFSKNGIDFSKIHGKQKAGAEKNCSGFSVSHMLHRVRTYALSSM